MVKSIFPKTTEGTSHVVRLRLYRDTPNLLRVIIPAANGNRKTLSKHVRSNREMALTCPKTVSIE